MEPHDLHRALRLISATTRFEKHADRVSGEAVRVAAHGAASHEAHDDSSTPGHRKHTITVSYPFPANHVPNKHVKSHYITWCPAHLFLHSHDKQEFQACE